MDTPRRLILVGLVSFFQVTAAFHLSPSQPTTRPETVLASSAAVQIELPDATETVELPKSKSCTRRVSILLCPAQFCVPDDYQVFFQELTTEYPDTIATCRVAPLPRTEWIKVAKKLPTLDFVQATLPVESTLDWYFKAIEAGLADILADQGPDAEICLVGHSIGGWVARAYLGGLSKSSTSIHRMANIKQLITLGSPHASPASGLVDQTRGLLAAVNQEPACSPQALADRGIAITCVCSSSLKGNFVTTNVEEFVAAASYIPLTGQFRSQAGDGIVPLELAFLDEPAQRVVLDACPATEQEIRHSHVLPMPWNLWNPSAPSIILPVASYFSKDVVPLWSKYIV